MSEECVNVSSADETESDNDEEQRKVDELSEQEQRKRLSEVNQAIAALKNEREAPPSPEPPTPERLYGDDPADFDPDYGPSLHHISGTSVKPIGDYLKDVRVVPVDAVPDLGEDTLVAVPRQTVAIMHSLGLEYKYFTDSKRMKRLAGVAPPPADYIKQRRINSE